MAVGRADTRLRSSDGVHWTGSAGYGNLDLTDAWGDGTGRAWAVGNRGRIVRFSKAGTATEMTSPTQANLVAVHGTGRKNIWAAAQYNQVLHYDGKTWTVIDVAAAVGIPVVALNDVWCSPQGEVWLAGQSVIVHFDGVSWHTVGFAGTEVSAMQQFSSVWGAPSGAVYFTSRSGQGRREGLWKRGEDGFVHPVPGVETFLLRDVQGTSDDDIWAVGDSDILHFDGQSWNVVYRTWLADRIAPEGVARPKLLRVSAVARDEAWFMGPRGTWLRFDGASFHDVSTDDPAMAHEQGGYFAASTLTKLAGTSCEDYWLFGSGGSLHHDAASTDQTWSFEPGRSPYGIIAATVAGGTVVRVDQNGNDDLEPRALVDGEWRSLGALHGLGIFEAAIWGTSLADLWLAAPEVGKGLFHYDGVAWTPVDIGRESGMCSEGHACPVYPRYVSGTAPDNVWVYAGRDLGWGQLFRFDGRTWTVKDLSGEGAPNHVSSMFVDDESHGWLGEWGMVYEVNGDDLTVHAFDGHQAIWALARTPDGVLHAAGGSQYQTVYPNNWIENEHSYGFMARYDGARWTLESSGADSPLASFFVCPDRPSLIAAGGDGVIEQVSSD